MGSATSECGREREHSVCQLVGEATIQGLMAGENPIPEGCERELDEEVEVGRARQFVAIATMLE